MATDLRNREVEKAGKDIGYCKYEENGNRVVYAVVRCQKESGLTVP